ncbi:ABC transporter ATP-binding protein, partial [Sabulibacter ruber]|uniref:ATP-binding cassette domain-containing protein n=1 Tax=Sabulibacter ruber TaxID=2811901 RepID=UPI001F61D43C
TPAEPVKPGAVYPVIEFERVTVRYGKDAGATQALAESSFHIDKGDFIALVGPSGCGKSTLLRLIAGLEDVSSGTISIDGKDATRLPPAGRGLAMVFQSYALYPHMTVRNNIAFPLK